MACLANTVQANSDSFYFALAGGGGGGSSLQSPVSVLPDVNGTVAVNLVSAEDASLTISAGGSNPANLNILCEAGGDADIFMGINNDPTQIQIAAPTGAKAGQLNIINGNFVTFHTIDTVLNDVTLGAPLGTAGVPSGMTTSNNSVVIKDEAGGPNNALLLSTTSPTASFITQGVASGGVLNLGSSVATPGTIAISDAGAGTAQVAVGGNGGPSIILKGGNTTTSPNPSIVGSAGNFGTVQFGSDAIHPNILSLGVTVGGGNVTVGGNGGVGVTLEGGAGTTASIATTAVNTATLQLGPSGQYPNALTFSDLGVGSGTTTVLNSVNTTLNGLVRVPGSLSFQGSGNIIAFLTLQTTGVVCGDNTTASIPNPAGLVTGLYLILARGGSAFCSVSAISYYNGSTWSWGGGGCCPAFVSAPPSYIGIQGFGATLTLANGGGAGSVTMDFTYLQLGGGLGI